MPPVDVVLRHFELLNRGESDDAARCFSVDATNNGRQVGREGVALVLRSLLAAFSDHHLEVIEHITAGDVVVCRVVMTGTHDGSPTVPFVMGGVLADVEPTGRRVEVQHQHWFRIRDGEITEHWAVRDDLGMAQQLGLVPVPPARS